ncbi:hypothetical protein P170DRAFT_5386 [Aspergillus steynii IBT 23096]|uniref:Prion-inhibition and propagation HeLo domain-containing protein n=1 Tax=Aspergillus steynii IBT 23096 TaxID=1392250 RepID=A0A2I2GLU3_9EURO|nr:uncharacterized protein P170DRAFT_5386 [Aspergillus steynii IBT 23096]PLB53845.1 hypothetical protein P170DRAFT_5386 [Aspergillus steynii IBT 23096]
MSAQHNKLLNDPRTLSIVKDLLSAISYICGPDDHFPPFESKRQRLSWALGVKVKQIIQVKQFSSIVQILHSLIPINTEAISGHNRHTHRASSLRDTGDATGVQGDWLADFRSMLIRIESEIEAEARRDLQIWLLGNHTPNNRYEAYKGKRMEGTCKWVLPRQWFQD